jgi:YidC/Oxa1 family membrane protein insertase
VDFLRNIAAEALIFFYNLTKDYGLAIILLTFAVRIITLPLSMKQMASSRAMQEIAPERKKLEEKYRNDKEKLNQAMLELYREHKINPFGGCLPVLIQFPVLIAIFGVLRNPDIMKNAIADFSPLFLNLINLNLSFKELVSEGTGLVAYLVPAIIPLFAGLTTYLQTKLTTAGQEQAAGGMGAMTLMMPIMIVAFSYSLPQGLPLYWLVGNIFSIGQHLIMNRPKPASEGGV